MRFTIEWLMAAVVACAVSACGTKAAPAQEELPPEIKAALAPPDPRQPTACSLIGQEEMGRLLGGAVAAPAASERGNSSTCTYTPAAGKGLTPYAQVKIDWHGGEAAMAGMKLADRFMSKDAGFSIVDKIDGVGDEASMMIGGVMNVRKGALFMTIDLRMQPHAKEKGVAIAQAILARVEGAGR